MIYQKSCIFLLLNWTCFHSTTSTVTMATQSYWQQQQCIYHSYNKNTWIVCIFVCLIPPLKKIISFVEIKTIPTMNTKVFDTRQNRRATFSWYSCIWSFIEKIGTLYLIIGGRFNIFKNIHDVQVWCSGSR